MVWETKDRLMTLSQEQGVARHQRHRALMSDPDKSIACLDTLEFRIATPHVSSWVQQKIFLIFWTPSKCCFTSSKAAFKQKNVFQSGLFQRSLCSHVHQGLNARERMLSETDSSSQFCISPPLPLSLSVSTLSHFRLCLRSCLAFQL